MLLDRIENFDIFRPKMDSSKEVLHAIATFQAFTFEEALDATIEKIEGTNGLRPNLLARTDAVEQTLTGIVTQLKGMPPEAFQDPKPEEDVSGGA